MSKMQTLTSIAAVLAFSMTGVAHASEAPASPKVVKHVTVPAEAKCGAHKSMTPAGAKLNVVGKAKSASEAKCGAHMKKGAEAKPMAGMNMK